MCVFLLPQTARTPLKILKYVSRLILVTLISNSTVYITNEETFCQIFNGNYTWVVIYKGESVNRSQMDIKRKTCDIWTWKKKISRHILQQHWYMCPIALPVRRNPQHRSLFTVVSATSTPPFQPLRHQRNFCHTVVNYFRRQTLSHHKRETFLYEYPFLGVLLPTKKKKSTTERCSSIHSSSTVAILTTHFSLWTWACASAT
jgi:hypothetical protein